MALDVQVRVFGVDGYRVTSAPLSAVSLPLTTSPGTIPVTATAQCYLIDTSSVLGVGIIIGTNGNNKISHET